MKIPDVLSAYDAEVRAKPVPRAGLAVEDDGQIIQLVGSFNFICSWRFGSAGARGIVQRHAARFRALGQRLMWRVYDHDGPPELSACLAENGFEPDPPATLMFLDLEDVSTGDVGGVDVRRVSTDAQLADFLAAADQAFGDQHAADDHQAYLDRMRDPTFALFVAYLADLPVASARLETAGRFGQLYGGGVHPAYRGRGLYRALVHARAAEAKRQGARYLSTEARETSRPILERLGFVSAGREVTWVLPEPAGRAPGGCR